MAIEWRRFLKTEPCTCGGWFLAVGNLAELLFHGLPQHTEVDSQSPTQAPSWVCLKKCLIKWWEKTQNTANSHWWSSKYHQSSCFYSNDFNYHNYHVNWRWPPHVWINPSHRKVRMAELHQVYSGHKCQTLRVVTLHLNGTRHIAPQQMSFIACSFCFRKNSSMFQSFLGPEMNVKLYPLYRIKVNQHRKQANSMRKMLFNTIMMLQLSQLRRFAQAAQIFWPGAACYDIAATRCEENATYKWSEP